ncbi:hypothetical protein PIB30_018228 [Stylosanthes scabra]|uniref:Uncharacterized protein n=1 Tax=Stylosanthes scabra TaxID=79078 RepID=A0ABU6V9F4_9FABA|nr:hypothetical protein [Stylosanthes scabra]
MASIESQIRASYRVIIDMHCVGNNILDYDMLNLRVTVDVNLYRSLKNFKAFSLYSADHSNDPCGDGWVGIGCINVAITFVTTSHGNWKLEKADKLVRQFQKLRIYPRPDYA